MPRCIFPLNNANEKREIGRLIQTSQEDADFPLRLVQRLSSQRCGSPVFESVAIKWSWNNLNIIYSFDGRSSLVLCIHFKMSFTLLIKKANFPC